MDRWFKQQYEQYSKNWKELNPKLDVKLNRKMKYEEWHKAVTVRMIEE